MDIKELASHWEKVVSVLQNENSLPIKILTTLKEFREKLDEYLVATGNAGSQEDLNKIFVQLDKIKPLKLADKIKVFNLDHMSLGMNAYPYFSNISDEFSGEDNPLSTQYSKTLSLLNIITNMAAEKLNVTQDERPKNHERTDCRAPAEFHQQIKTNLYKKFGDEQIWLKTAIAAIEKQKALVFQSDPGCNIKIELLNKFSATLSNAQEKISTALQKKSPETLTVAYHTIGELNTEVSSLLQKQPRSIKTWFFDILVNKLGLERFKDNLERSTLQDKTENIRDNLAKKITSSTPKMP